MKKAMTKGVLVQHLRIYEVPVTLRENEDMLEISVEDDPLIIISMTPEVRKILQDISR